MSTAGTNIFDNYLRDLELQELRKPKTRTALHRAMRECGLESITCHFRGEGDSGGIEEIEGLPAKAWKGVESLAVIHKDGSQLFKHPARDTAEAEAQAVVLAVTGNDAGIMTMRDLAEEIAYEQLEKDYPGWEINEGTYGRVTIAANGDVDIDLTHNPEDHGHGDDDE
jgi:hypothetical protein